MSEVILCCSGALEVVCMFHLRRFYFYVFLHKAKEKKVHFFKVHIKLKQKIHAIFVLKHRVI